MPTNSLQVSLAGRDLPALLASVVRSQLVAAGPPALLNVDSREQPVTADWPERWAARCERDVFATWDDAYQKFVSLTRSHVVKAATDAITFDEASVLAWLEDQPFEVASFGPIFPGWFSTPGFPAAGFGDLHFPLGWACAFRGDGHRRLASRRWLEHGPWRLTRGRDDLSFVQFHGIDAQPRAAFELARPAHQRMGVNDRGGYIQSDYVYTFPLDGLYLARERHLKVLVHGREVSQLEMLDACAARLYQALGPERPLDSVAYVFADEVSARAHLHELWLRELECWTFVGGREVRLDSDYRPPR